MAIESSIPLPDLPETDFRGEVSIRLGHITGQAVNDLIGSRKIFENPGVRVRASKRAMYFEWDRLGKVLVRDGREVIVEPDKETLTEDLQPFLTGPVLAVLLHQRGYFVLHASAIEIGGGAAAFLGAKGRGKSTLAAYLKARGHRLISDDIVPVSFSGDAAWTTAGFPRIKLYDDSIKAIGEDPANFPSVHRFIEKRSYQFPEIFSARTIRLHGVYILDDGEAIDIERMKPIDAFIEVTKNTHLNRYLEATKAQTEYFIKCQKFIRGVPVFRLSRPHDLNRMDEIGLLLEEHAPLDLYDGGDAGRNGNGHARHELF